LTTRRGSTCGAGDSLTSAQTAADAGPTIPQAGVAFALVKDIDMEYAEVVAER
jgi:hypothetical protein